MKWRIALIVTLVFAVAIGGLYIYSKSRPSTEGRAVVPGVLHAGDSEFDYYRPKVSILQPIGEVSTNYVGDRIAIVSGTIFNEGDWKLEAVELKVTLSTREGKPLKQEIKTPIQPMFWPHKPVPGLGTRGFHLQVDRMPVEWDPRRVDLEVYGLKFAK